MVHVADAAIEKVPAEQFVQLADASGAYVPAAQLVQLAAEAPE